MLGCNTNAGKCTGISQCLVNSSKHSSGWYSSVRKTLLIFNWITVTKTVHINHIRILCNWICKWHRERNRRTEMRTHTGLTGTLHCPLLPHTSLRNYRCTVLKIRSQHSHGNVSDKGFWTRSSSWVIIHWSPTPPLLHFLNSTFQVSRCGNWAVCVWASQLAKLMLATQSDKPRFTQERVWELKNAHNSVTI
jgi:hypothetical protein